MLPNKPVKPAHPDFPSMRWNPETGESQVFSAPHEVPDGWLDQHPNSVSGDDKAAAKSDTKTGLPLTKAEIVEALNEYEIPFKANTGAKGLYELLETSLKAHLAAEKVEIPADANVPALLALVKANTKSE